MEGTDDLADSLDDTIQLIKVRRFYNCPENYDYAVFERDDKAHLKYLRHLADWLIADICGNDRHNTANCVLVPFLGGYCPMDWYLEMIIQPTVRGNGLVAEAWEYEYSQKVHEHAEKMNGLLGRAMLAASDCIDDDLDVLSQDASEAVTEARRLLYGF
jgi:hypothetical protein